MKIEPINELRDICQASVLEKEGIYAHWYKRKVSIYLTKILLLCRLTANQTTVLGILVGLMGSLFFLVGEYWSNIIGVLLLHLWHILDNSDGEIARYRNSCSETGVFLDELSHNFINFGSFACIGFGLYADNHNAFVIVLGFIAAFSLTLTYHISALKASVLFATGDKRKSSNPRSKNQNSEKGFTISHFIRKIFAFFFSRSFFWTTGGIVWILLLSALFDKLLWALLFFTCTTPFRLAFRIAETIRELNGDLTHGA